MPRKKDTRILGMTQNQERHTQELYRDTRTVWTKIYQSMHAPTLMVSIVMGIGAMAFFLPALQDLAVLVALALTGWALTRQEDYILKVPIQEGLIDGETGKTGEGIFYVGNCRQSGRQIWLTNDDCRQHMLLLGTTGAGKTETLLGFVVNALSWSSGVLFCDGKGDVSVFAKVYALARRFGREDDILVLNFMTGNKDLSASQGDILSNTLNPFATGSSDSLTQMVVSLMDDAGGDSAMWKGRATAMFTGVMRGLAWLRDQGLVDLNVGTIRDTLRLTRIIDLAYSEEYKDMPVPIRKSLHSYLSSLPGFVQEKGYKQAQTTLDQHGYLDMQFTKILGSLADVYGHIFATPYGEVDMVDVVLNRRILFIMLPALEKAPDEIANLGKIVVSNLKGMMGATLGSSIQGDWTNVVDKRVTSAPSPFLCIMDEIGYYTVNGIALMTAQARSLGFSIVAAAQDTPAMKRLDEKEAASIFGNTNTKFFMRIEDMGETMKLAVESAGKAQVSRVSGFKYQAGEWAGNYHDNLDAQMQEVDRINPLDVKKQEAGEFIMVHKGYVIYGRAFYANPEGSLNRHLLQLGANHFLRIEKPSTREIENQEALVHVTPVLMDPLVAEEVTRASLQILAGLEAAAQAKDEIALFAKSFEVYHSRNKAAGTTQAACAAIGNVVGVLGGLADMILPRAATSASVEDDLDDEEDGDGDLHLPPLADDEDDYSQYSPEDDRLDNKAIEDFLRAESGGYGDVEDLARRSAPPPVRTGKKSVVADETVKHGVTIAGAEIEDVSKDVGTNDAILRTLGDLRFDPDEETTDTVDEKLNRSIGTKDDPNFEKVAKDDEIDHAVVASEKIRDPLAQSAQTSEVYLTEFLNTLIEGDDDD